MGRRKRKHRLALSGRHTAARALVTGLGRPCTDTAAASVTSVHTPRQRPLWNRRREPGVGGGAGWKGRAFTRAPSGSQRRAGVLSGPPPHSSFPSKNSEACRFQLIFLKRETHKSKVRLSIYISIQFGLNFWSRTQVYVCVISLHLWTASDLREALGVSPRKGSSRQTHGPKTL